MHVHAWQVAAAIGVGVVLAGVTFGVRIAGDIARYFEGVDEIFSAPQVGDDL